MAVMGTRRQKKKNLRKWVILVNNIHRGSDMEFFLTLGSKKNKIPFLGLFWLPMKWNMGNS